jgi:hypothetical protein
MTTDFAPRRARLAESEELQIETPAANGVYADSLLTLSCIACFVFSFACEALCQKNAG